MGKHSLSSNYQPFLKCVFETENGTPKGAPHLLDGPRLRLPDGSTCVRRRAGGKHFCSRRGERRGGEPAKGVPFRAPPVPSSAPLSLRLPGTGFLLHAVWVYPEPSEL